MQRHSHIGDLLKHSGSSVTSNGTRSANFFRDGSFDLWLIDSGLGMDLDHNMHVCVCVMEQSRKIELYLFHFWILVELSHSNAL